MGDLWVCKPGSRLEPALGIMSSQVVVEAKGETGSTSQAHGQKGEGRGQTWHLSIYDEGPQHLQVC